MAYFDTVISKTLNSKSYIGNPPTTEEEYNTFDCWQDTSIKPTWAEVEAAVSLLEIQDARARTYPSIGDQLDMIFHAGLGGDDFQAAIQAVKDANPKT